MSHLFDQMKLSPYSSGVEIQKLSIINNLTRLLEKNSADVNRKVIPVLRVSGTVWNQYTLPSFKPFDFNSHLW